MKSLFIVILCISFLMSNACAIQQNTMSGTLLKVVEGVFPGDTSAPVFYYIENNVLFVGYYKIADDNLIKYIEQYTNSTLSEYKFSLSQNNYVNNYAYNKSKFIIDENQYIYYKDFSYMIYDLVLVKNGKEKKIFDNQFADRSTFFYDNKNKKFYFDSGDGVNSGIFIYDVVKDNAKGFIVNSYNDIEYFSSPIRIPNTEYLFYIGSSYNQDSDDSRINFYTKEIPEWKKEIELQNKNIKKYPNAKKVFLDGPAVIRKKPKGEILSSLNDWTEVLILEQKDDWYKILYADVEGWTYKDNIKK